MSATCSCSKLPGAVQPDGAEVAHVEDHGVLAAGAVLGERPVRIGQRHLPAAELDQLCTELAVGPDQGGVPERPLALST